MRRWLRCYNAAVTTRPHGGPGSLFILDAYNLIFRAYHGLPPMTSPDGRPVNAVHGYVRMIQALRKDFAPERVVAVFDAPGPSFRDAWFPQYKANRSETPEDLVPQLSLVRDATTALGIPSVEIPDVEADDAIASYACAGHRAGLEVVIVSSDKDLMQLVTEVPDGHSSIHLWDAMKGRMLGAEEVAEKWGVRPAQLGDLLALTGDSADNVPGVPGIGPKTAAELLIAYSNLEAILAAAAAGEIKQKKRRENLVEFADAARLSRRLVELKSDLPLPLELEKLRDEGPSREALESFFTPLGFRSTLAGLLATVGEGGARKSAAQASTHVPSAVEQGGAWAGPRAARWHWSTPGALQEVLDAARSSGGLVVRADLEGSDPLRAALVAITVVTADDAGPAPVCVAIEHGDPLTQSATPLPLELAAALADETLPLVIHDAKTCITALAVRGVEVRGLRDDPMLVSYVLDAARSAHELEALAVDFLGYEPSSLDKRLGKGKQRLTLGQLGNDDLAAHAGERCEITRAVQRHLESVMASRDDASASIYRELELPLTLVLAKMELRGICVDGDELRRQGTAMEAELSRLRAQINEFAGEEVHPESNKQLQELLFVKRGLPAGKKTKTGFSVDASVLEELSLLDPIVNPILEHRSLSKLKGTYLDTLPNMVNARSGRLHTQYRQAVAQTGRISSTEPNLQNIPIRSEIGRRIRRGFIASPGRVLVAMDYSQIELRVLAHMSGDAALVSAFQEGVDVHRRTAAELFEVPLLEVTGEQRRVAKAVNFGVIYGQQAFGLARTLGIPRGKAAKYIKDYFRAIPGVSNFMEELIRRARQTGYAETIAGRRRRIPELAGRGAAAAYGERIARNTPIQGSAADILKRAMIDVEAALKDVTWAQMLLTVHDELIFECEQEQVSRLIEIAKPIMEGAAKLVVPLEVGAGVGPNWEEAKD